MLLIYNIIKNNESETVGDPNGIIYKTYKKLSFHEESIKKKMDKEENKKIKNNVNNYENNNKLIEVQRENYILKQQINDLENAKSELNNKICILINSNKDLENINKMQFEKYKEKNEEINKLKEKITQLERKKSKNSDQLSINFSKKKDEISILNKKIKELEKINNENIYYKK